MATTTTTPRRRGVIHHLLREIDPSEPELTPSEFSSLAVNVISDISSYHSLPLIIEIFAPGYHPITG
ncbi:hypothetical protein LguiB_035174 [Lonicera macranthoides]